MQKKIKTKTKGKEIFNVNKLDHTNRLGYISMFIASISIGIGITGTGKDSILFLILAGIFATVGYNLSRKASRQAREYNGVRVVMDEEGNERKVQQN